MKILIFLTFLLISGLNSAGANPPKTNTSSYPYEFHFDEDSFLYDRLGFGDSSVMFTFMKSRIGYVTVTIKDQGGHQDHNNPALQFFPESESFEEFVVRTSNLQLTHAMGVNNFPTNQTLTISYRFLSGVPNGINGATHYFTELLDDDIPFLPVLLKDGSYGIPDGLAGSLNLQVPNGVLQQIPWSRIARASLVVFDHKGSVIYTGDSRKNFPSDTNLSVFDDYSLFIGKRFITNGCNGVLTVATAAGTSGMYLIADGSFVYYPQTIQPLLSIIPKNGVISIGIQGGAPGRAISLLCYTALDTPPHEEILTLDEVGSLIWTNQTTSAPAGFFSTNYPQE